MCNGCFVELGCTDDSTQKCYTCDLESDIVQIEVVEESLKKKLVKCDCQSIIRIEGIDDHMRVCLLSG